MLAKFQIKIDKTKVQGSHTNFLYLFSESCINLPTGLWGNVVNVSGLDIRFYDTDKSTELKREVVLFDSLNKKLEIWVQIPSLSSTLDKYIWCTYGGATRANDASVWTDVGCKSCIHMQTLMNDSAEGYTASISTPTQISNGKINKAYSFNGTGDNASIARSTAPVSNSSYTVSAWAYCTGSNSDNEQTITSDGATSYNYILALTNGRNLNSDNYPGWELLGYDGAGWRGVGSNQAISGQYNGWHHVVGTYDGDKFRIYVDGALKNTSAHYVLSLTPITTIHIGDFITLSHFLGYIEELRHYNVVRSDDWIATEYANQNDPATFSQCSAETFLSGKLRGLIVG